jgi:hypothetical protein
MLQDGIEAVLVKTACPPGLIPTKHLNKTLGTLYYSGLFEKLHDRYQFHYCGEGGEYESIVLDCPLYKKRLVLDDVDIVETNDGVGELIIKKFHTEAKDEVKANIPHKDLQTKSEDPPVKLPRQHPANKPVGCLPHVQASIRRSPSFLGSDESHFGAVVAGYI